MAININLKQVQVRFHPSTDTTLFVKKVYNDIRIRGLMLTDLNLIHCAMIHYQSRFKTNLSRRFQYTYLTIEPTLLEDSKHFYFDDGEKAELQTQSSEVIGVGFAIALFQKLFDVNFNCINEIISTGKRCDFEIHSRGKRIIAESKGRKGGLKKAINEIIIQKSSYPTAIPKYGAISIIERDVNPVEITVVDPPSKMDNINRNERVLAMLIHYTKVAQLSGYSQLASLLNERIDEISKDHTKVEYYELKKIQYKDNVVKLGYEVYTNIRDHKFCTFFSNNNKSGFKFIVKDNLQIYFGLDKKVKNYLEDQNYEALLNFSGEYYNLIELSNVSVHNDGTCLILIENTELEKAKEKNILPRIFGDHNLHVNVEE
ncbi:MAG: hypothetical protein ACQEU4_18625 [Bacillota bacterium]|jgi:hypothetical protein